MRGNLSHFRVLDVEISAKQSRGGARESCVSLQLPATSALQGPPTTIGNMPSSFKGAHGKIVYGLEAKMKRPWKLSRNEKCTITFVSRHTEDMAQLMCPQFGSIDKKMKLFTSGTASLKAETDKKAYVQGEMLRVTTAIENSSSRDLKPKFKLEQKISFIASSSTKNSWGSIFKDSGQPVPSKSQQTMTREFKLPADLTPTIMHCKIIKVEYTLKVYLDVPYASDPEVLFPLVILPVTKHYGPGLTGPFSGMSDFPSAYPAYPPPPGPGIYPSLFPSGVQPQPANPGMPSPSSKQETYPTAPAAGPYPTAPGPYPVPPAPGYYLNPAAPGPYTSPSVPESYLTPNAPGSYPVPSAPESFLTPSAPGVYPTLNAPQFNLNPTEPPPSYAEVFPNPCGPEFSPLSKTADQNKPSK
ncbi:arrestin domain-containing protein 3-like isoform X2 [Denticeps clupeoides]|uniref:arrestin domain-containing protein 3-like isoform X2 n=1 Tax=Denticeps clupeoides TaxID=299321 RepID=UPI0010A51D6D|nr:arrestin domain-containing protein 3-like isoform X2 [Denticeps clupeoides]